jgi:energy-converting hydrogenase Eha subunit F
MSFEHLLVFMYCLLRIYYIYTGYLYISIFILEYLYCIVIYILILVIYIPDIYTGENLYEVSLPQSQQSIKKPPLSLGMKHITFVKYYDNYTICHLNAF